MIKDQVSSNSYSNKSVTPNVHVLWRRFFAALLDVVFLSLLGLVVHTTFGVTRVTGGMLPAIGKGGMSFYSTATTVDWGWQLLLAFSYFFVQEALFSTTPGKAILKLRIIPAADDRERWHISIWQAFLRNFLRPLEVTQIPYSFSVGFITALCIFFTKKRQRVGDLLARTIVVDSEAIFHQAYRRSQIYLRATLFLVVLVSFTVFCGFYYYYDRPPLVIQELQNTHQLMSDKTVQSYALGSPTWGTEQTDSSNTAKTTITYPIQIIAIDDGKTDVCTGSITLHWNGFPTGWIESGSSWQCLPKSA